MLRTQRLRTSTTGWLTALCAGLVLALTLSGCGSSGSSAQASGGGLTKVKMSSLQGAADFATYFALDQGDFKKNGLDVQLVPLQSTSDIPALLSSGGLDFALGAPGAGSYNAVQQGVVDPVVLVPGAFAADTKVPGLVVRKSLVDSGAYTSAADLKGKKIAIIAPMTSSQYFVSELLKSVGLQDSDVQFVTMALPDMLTALSNGAIDAAWMFEPLASKAVSSGVGVVETGVGQVAAGFPSSWLQASESMAKDHPDTVKAFVTSMLEGMAYYRKLLKAGNRNAIISVLAKYTTLKDPADWAGVELPSVSDDGDVDIASLQKFEDFLMANGAVKTQVDPSKLVDMSFLHAVASSVTQ